MATKSIDAQPVQTERGGQETKELRLLQAAVSVKKSLGSIKVLFDIVKEDPDSAIIASKYPEVLALSDKDGNTTAFFAALSSEEAACNILENSPTMLRYSNSSGIKVTHALAFHPKAIMLLAKKYPERLHDSDVYGRTPVLMGVRDHTFASFITRNYPELLVVSDRFGVRVAHSIARFPDLAWELVELHQNTMNFADANNVRVKDIAVQHPKVALKMVEQTKELLDAKVVNQISLLYPEILQENPWMLALVGGHIKPLPVQQAVPISQCIQNASDASNSRKAELLNFLRS